MILFDIFTKLKNTYQNRYQNSYQYNTHLKFNKNLVSNMPPLFLDKYADIRKKTILQKKIKDLYIDTNDTCDTNDTNDTNDTCETNDTSKVITYSGFNVFFYCCISFFVIIPIRKYYLTHLVI